METAPASGRAATAAPPAAGGGIVHHHVHHPAFKLGAFQCVDSDGGGVVIELDDGEAACTARTVPRDPQRPDLAERRKQGLQIAGGGVRR